jgi:DNA transformation protein and related proteins
MLQNQKHATHANAWILSTLFHVEHPNTHCPAVTAPQLSALPGLGPKSTAMLRAAGIHTVADLQALGSVAAYVAVKRVTPHATLNLLWALEGALTGMGWQQVAAEHRTGLLLALEHVSPECLPR